MLLFASVHDIGQMGRAHGDARLRSLWSRGQHICPLNPVRVSYLFSIVTLTHTHAHTRMQRQTHFLCIRLKYAYLRL